jgi:trehalose 6-phosphate synthase/phosphatase
MSRLLIVSNRLPVNISRKHDGFVLQPSAGGLVTGLQSFVKQQKKDSTLNFRHLWVGWPGIAPESKKEAAILERKLHGLKQAPVFLSEADMENFYLGFCNKTIWPLFHYFTTYAEYEKEYWLTYQRVNRIFCDALLKIIREGDTIWIHDYHLMLLPQMIRQKFPKSKIGFFLHIPFPTFEVFRLLPGAWRQEILRGILGADLIGFHTNDYTQYFLRCAQRILGLEHEMGKIMLEERHVKVETFPMGIDFQAFHQGQQAKETLKERSRLKQELKKRKAILSIDRLDYSKGIINRLEGFELFLQKNPAWHEKVQLIMVVVPSRVGVTQYLETKRQIDELVGKINGRYATLAWTPVLYQFKFLSFPELVALYSVSEIGLITPLRDGMNLIAKEFIASKSKDPGVLILSEKAGVSAELGEAIAINPYFSEEIADAILEALLMPRAEGLKRQKAMQNRLRRYDIFRWTRDFMQHLQQVKDDQGLAVTNLLEPSRKKILRSFQKAKQRLLFFDYDGTLVPIVKHYSQAIPDARMLALLRELADNPRNEVVIATGRDRKTIRNWIGISNCSFIAEHGAWIKSKKGNWKNLKAVVPVWKKQVLPILETYSDRLPGSFVEKKEFSLTWHFRGAEPELGMLRAKELTDYLLNFTANQDLQVLQGKKVVEVRMAGINKGLAALNWLESGAHDFILAAGDDWTDEDLFKVLPKTACSIKVGLTPSLARFNVINYKEIIALLRHLNDS